MGFQKKTLELFDKVNGILAEYDGPLTLRQIYYRLVAAQYIENVQKAYTLLSKHLTNARRAGIVDPNRIIDRTRRTLKVPTWTDLEEFLEAVSRSYRREKWATGQQRNVEVWCEKDAVAGVLEPITEEFEVVLYPCRGYNSYSALLEAAERIAGKQQPTTILYLGDFDPSGQDMPRDIRDRLHNDFGVSVDLQVIALTPEQIEQFDLPPAPAKKSDSRAANFIARHGDMAVELDALPPDELQRLVREGIEEFVDLSTFQQEEETEAEEQRRLEQLIRDTRAT